MRFVLLILLILEGTYGMGQGKGPFPPIIRKLASVHGPVNTISFTNDPFIHGLPYPHENTGATFLKTKAELLALVNGTGRVYALDSLSGEYNWRRLDSTYFSGYNIDCLTFYADSTVWSFGGYGLWNNNGNLRYYAKNKFEWEIKPLNLEIPHIFDNSDLYWLDTANARLYMLGTRFVNDGLKDNSIQEKEIGHKTWCLDIRNGNWEALGESPDTALRVVAYSPWGMLAFRNGIPTIADFAHNRYLAANATGDKKFSAYSSSTKHKNLAFFVDSTLYFGDFDQYIDSMTISRADFTDSGVAIYTPFLSGNSRTLWFLAVLPLMAAGVLVYYKRKKPVVAMAAEIVEQDPLALLDERDRSLLQSIYHATRNNRTSDIDTINSILGVSNKSSEIQKRQRSDALNAINHKIAKVLQTNAEVIIRTRSEQDGRTYYYTVNPDLLEPLGSLLNKQK
ncbi:hypothetical protein [Flavihumibacter profundi]|uniref:hypothetical protein n=1 Tax=Flavihumibacter profundi TaxID=2716883 RepID=UPI001CC57A55|nr:hypothetical protein [Flavihumibacter profundi]MBZ5857549.1 hypothetical protein [Flavihumibacter profundi]